jgi:hypothetical protein
MNRKLAPQIALSAMNAGSQDAVGLGGAGEAAIAAARVGRVVGVVEGVADIWIEPLETGTVATGTTNERPVT